MSEIKINSHIHLTTDNEVVIKQCIEENTFANPIYLSNEQNGRSNWQTERTIETFRHYGNNLILPRGYMRNLLKIFHEHNIELKIIDERVSQFCEYPDNLSGIILRSYQERVTTKGRKYDQGVVVSPTGSGKSIIGLEIIRQRQQKALIIVHRADLAKQWINLIRERLEIEAGLLGDGKWDLGDQLTVGMIQSLSSKSEEVKKLGDTFGLVLVDEVHHIPAESFSEVIGYMRPKYLYGLSATVGRRDGLEAMIYRTIGPTIEIISKNEVEDIGAVVPATVKAIDTGIRSSANSWHEYLTEISINAERNIFIINLAINQTSPVLILTDRVAHAEDLSQMLCRRNFMNVLAHGQVKNRDELMEKIKKAPITVATTSLIGEGIDVSSWGVLIMATPISSEIKLLQSIGRIVRPNAEGKESALVYDLRDDCGFSGASFKKRFEIYKKNKIWVEFINKKAA